MNKINVINKAGRTQFVIKSLKGQQLNENEVYVINSDKVVGLLPVEVVTKGSKFKLIYETTSLMTLKAYLVAPLNKEKFAWILQCILWNLEEMERVYLNQQYLLLDVDKVMVDSRTRQIYFAYVPIQFYESGYSLRDFLLDIVRWCCFEISEDTDYVQEYFSILNTGMNFSVFSLEQFIDRLLGQEIIREQETVSKKDMPQKSTLSENKSYGKGVYNPLSNDNGGTMDSRGEGATEFQGAWESAKRGNAYLVRVETGERVLIDKNSFCVGKDAACNDYVVTGNPAVSRKHAEIIMERGRYYIFDLKSTNKTYVNGKAVPDAEKVELISEAKVRLANEEFIFLVG